MILLLLVGGIYFYKTYALYEEKKEYNVLKGIVPDFTTLTVKYIVDGKETITPPSKSESTLSQITCSGVKNYSWDNEMKKIKYNKSDITDKNIVCTVIFESPQMNDYLIDLSQTDTSIIKIEHEATNQTPALIDYRYVGKNPNNYVCFGSEEETCPEDNLYRIIGIIPTQSTNDGAYENRIKLIKATAYTETDSGYLQTNSAETIDKKGYAWNTANKNDWGSATLNLNVLNGVYWSNLGKYQNYIKDAVWYLGAPNYNYTGFKGEGTTYSNGAITSERFYTYERSNTKGCNSTILNYTTKIGLMYPSDYGYSLGNYNIYGNATQYKSESWLYDGNREWTITPEAVYRNRSDQVYSYNRGYEGMILVSYGAVQGGGSPYNYFNMVRPSFYLKKEVKFTKGKGTKEEPYRITL